MAGVLDLKKLHNDAFRVAGAMISCFVKSMFEASDAETVEGCKSHATETLLTRIISRGSSRSSYASAQPFCGRRNTFEASMQKSLERIGILRSSV